MVTLNGLHGLVSEHFGAIKSEALLGEKDESGKRLSRIYIVSRMNTFNICIFFLAATTVFAQSPTPAAVQVMILGTYLCPLDLTPDSSAHPFSRPD